MSKGLQLTNVMPESPELSGSHKFSLGPYNSCVHCGHLPLKNQISSLVTKLGCGYAKNAQYKRWVENGYKF